MGTFVIMVSGLALLSVMSGMVGLGVAFAAVPFLSIFLPDLVNQVQPLTLLLNGLTAFSAAIGFARSGYVDWKRAGQLAGIMAISAPIGAYLTKYINPTYILYAYFFAVLYLAYNIFKPVRADLRQRERFRPVLALAVPIAMLGGLLGIGPGFLLMPTMLLFGVDVKKAAGITAFAVTAPSFTALIPHLSTAIWDIRLTVALLVVGVVGSFSGARITSLHVSGAKLKQAFGVLICLMTAYKIYTIL